MDRDLVKGRTTTIIRVKGTISVNGFGIQLVLLVTEGEHENAGKKNKGAGAGKERHDVFIVAQEVRDPPYHAMPSFFCIIRTKI
jgi:hypothetical protein